MVISGDDVWYYGWCVWVYCYVVRVAETSAISCPLWSSVYECHRVECAFTSPVRTECCMSVSAVL